MCTLISSAFKKKQTISLCQDEQELFRYFGKQQSHFITQTYDRGKIISKDIFLIRQHKQSALTNS